jgi:hypothetical protein
MDLEGVTHGLCKQCALTLHKNIGELATLLPGGSNPRRQT